MGQYSQSGRGLNGVVAHTRLCRRSRGGCAWWWSRRRPARRGGAQGGGDGASRRPRKMRTWAKARPMRVEVTRGQPQRDFSHATTRPGPGAGTARSNSACRPHIALSGVQRTVDVPRRAHRGRLPGREHPSSRSRQRERRARHGAWRGRTSRGQASRPRTTRLDPGRMPGREIRHHSVEHSAPCAFDRRREAALVEVPRGGLEAADVGQRDPSVEYAADARRRGLAGGADNGALEKHVRGRGGDEESKSDDDAQHEGKPGARLSPGRGCGPGAGTIGALTGGGGQRRRCPRLRGRLDVGETFVDGSFPLGSMFRARVRTVIGQTIERSGPEAIPGPACGIALYGLQFAEPGTREGIETSRASRRFDPMPKYVSTAPRDRVMRPGQAWVSCDGRSVASLCETGGAAASAARMPLTPLRLLSHAAAAACRCPTVAASTVSARRACQMHSDHECVGSTARRRLG